MISFVNSNYTVNLTLTDSTFDVYRVVLLVVSCDLCINSSVVFFCSASEGRVGEKEEDEGEEGERLDRKLLGGNQPGSS